MNLFKTSPEAKLRKQYESLLKQAMEAQRGGDIVKCSELTSQADEILKQMDQAR